MSPSQLPEVKALLRKLRMEVSSLNNNGGLNSLWVSPSDSNFILVGLVNVFKSTNGGDNFTKITGGYILSAQPHVDIRFIANNPGYGTTNNYSLPCH